MLIAILGLAIVSLVVNLFLAAILVRSRDAMDNGLFMINNKVEKLAKEVVLRLPRRPYGVSPEDRMPTLTMGPIDTIDQIDQ